MLAEIFGSEGVAAAMVADAHAHATATADDQALQQGGPFARRSMAAIDPEGVGVGAQALEDLLVLGPGDVAGVGVVQEDQPLITRQHVMLEATIGLLLPAPSAEGIGAGVARVFQDAEHAPQIERLPDDLAFAGARVRYRGKRSLCSWKCLTTAWAVPVRRKVSKSSRSAGLDLLIGIEDDPTVTVVDQPHGQPDVQLSAPGLVDDSRRAGGLVERAARPRSWCP